MVHLATAESGSYGTVPPGGYAMLEVADNGIGMDGATQARIFDPFFTTKAVGKGTGLGLSTVYGIVAQSGGHIRVDSAPGRGTIFRVYWPLAGGDAAAPHAIERASASASPGHETILLVEDEDAVRELVAQVLQASGYVVLAAAYGEEALDVAQLHPGPIDLLLTDVVMPGLSGPDVAARLAVSHHETAVLYMSGYTDHPVVLEAAAASHGFLQKPFTPDVLGRAVRECLDARVADPRPHVHAG